MRKRSSIVVTHHDKIRVIVKGALEEVLKVCDMARVNGEEVPITKEITEKVNKKAEEMAKKWNASNCSSS